MKKRKLIFAILLTFSVVVRAQDIHWSHTPESRAMINPAENGIDTLLKSTLIYRNQWRSLITAFQTTGINVNTPLLKGWGAGITYYNDRAGSAGWQQNNAIISTTYTQKIKEVSVTLGLGLGLDQKSVDMDKFILPSQIDPNLSITPYSGAALATKSTSFDNSIGLFASCPFDKSLLEVGLSAGHLLANDLNVLGNPDARYKQLYTFNTHVLYNLNANWEIDPYFTYQNQAKFQKIVAGSRINYTQNGNKIYGGLGYRMNDAVMGQIGFSQGGFRAGISYDYTLSSMKGNVGSSSAFELVIGYDIAFKKKKVSTPSTKVDTFIKKIVPKTLTYYAFRAEVTDATSGEKINNFSYSILPNSRPPKETTLNEFIIDTLALNESYIITLKKENYFPISDTLENITADINKSYVMIPFEINKEYALRNIYYEFDKSLLTDNSKLELDKLVVFLNDNPKISIELSSHTDNKGEGAYNLSLSEERAKNCVAYLLSKGISSERLVAKGYGESTPIAQNNKPDGTDNSEGRAKNRRTEFKILSLGN